MIARLSEDQETIRRERVLRAARWYFLNFGFSKTSMDDIAKRAGISRTLLYKNFRDKEDIFTAVFAHWLVARHPRAVEAAAKPGSEHDRLLEVCRVLFVETRSDMVGAPMAGEFFDVCERLDPEISATHRGVSLECLGTVLGNEAVAEVFLLAIYGLASDEPTAEVFELRVRLLVARFASEATSEPTEALQARFAQ